MISSRAVLSGTGRKTFHPRRRDRVLIHLLVGLQEDLAFEGRGGLVGCVFVEVASGVVPVVMVGSLF